MNPYLPFEHCVPDGEARVFGGRCYVYGSYDLENGTDYCSHQYRVFSALLEDLEHWTDHGIAFASDQPQYGITWSQAPLYAPDVCEKDGKYYLYFCMSDGSEGVAVSDRPEGPFHDPVRLYYPEGIHGGKPLCHIDPSIFIDDDGTAYYYWGQFRLQAARLEEDMHTLCAESYVENLIGESTHWFHEGASMRKINGRYYLVFCSLVTGRANTLDYAIGDSPLGPFSYGGSIINNRSCDPSSWNIHGCIQPVGDAYYVFYHRSSNNSAFSRRACADRIAFDADGRIIPAEMTSMGFSASIPATRNMPALGACDRTGSCFFSREGGEVVLKNIGTANRLGYRYLDFTGGEQSFSIRLHPHCRGLVQLRVDAPTAEPAATLFFEESDGAQEYAVPVRIPAGRHSIWLDFHGEFSAQSLGELYSFRFDCTKK